MFKNQLNMKKLLLGLALLAGSQCMAQDLQVELKNGQQTVYGLSTVEKLTYSATEMEIHRVGGSTDKVLLSTVNYFNYSQGPISTIKQYEASPLNLALHPNPSTGAFFINYTAEATAYTLRLLNLSGQEVYSQSGQSSKGKNSLSVDVNNLPNGLYFAELKSGANKQIEKIVINK